MFQHVMQVPHQSVAISGTELLEVPTIYIYTVYDPGKGYMCICIYIYIIIYICDIPPISMAEMVQSSGSLPHMLQETQFWPILPFIHDLPSGYLT